MKESINKQKEIKRGVKDMRGKRIHYNTLFKILVTVCALILLAGMITGCGKEPADNAGNNEEVLLVSDNSTLSDNTLLSGNSTPTDEPEGQSVEDVENEEDISIQQVSNYTSVNSDEESLIQLVKDTIIGVDNDLQAAYEKNPDLQSVLSVIEGLEAVQHDDLCVNFMELVPEDMTLSVDSNLTVLDVSGSIGETVFEQFENFSTEGYTTEKELLGHLIGYGLYGADVDEISDWSVQADNIYKFLDGEIDFEINFDVLFNNNGVNYMALIGNVDGQYRVIDIINADKDQSVLELIENPVQFEDPQVEPTPEEEVIIDDSYNYSNTINDPGYQGEKEGYVYEEGLGYIPIVDDEGPDTRNDWAPTEEEAEQGERIGYM